MMKKKLDSYLEECLYYYDLPGLCVSVKQGDFSYIGVTGYRNKLTKEPLEEDDVFHMASVSKLFVATAIMQLCEEGKLTLDDKLVDILPWVAIDDERLPRITLRQMLNHTSGMADVSDYHWEMRETDEGALERYCRSDEVRESKLFWDPEEGKFRYSNIAYELLGCVISQASGKTFEEYIQDHIFDSLGMEDSTFLTFERDPSTMAKPHDKDKEKRTVIVEHYPYNRAHGPSSTLTSNGSDMQKWGDAHLDRKILSPESYEEMWKVYTEVPDNGEGMGLSWFMREQNGYRLLGHEGTDDGFRASFWICPELNCSISVMCNITRSPVKRINRGVFDILTKD